jgi:hypothetical protein
MRFFELYAHACTHFRHSHHILASQGSCCVARQVRARHFSPRWSRHHACWIACAISCSGGGSVLSPLDTTLSTQGSNTSGFAAVAFSAPPAGSTLAVLSVGGGRCSVRVQRRSLWLERLDGHTFDSLRARFLSPVDRPEAYSLCFIRGVFTRTRQLQGFKMGFSGLQFESGISSRHDAGHAGVGSTQARPWLRARKCTHFKYVTQLKRMGFLTTQHLGTWHPNPANTHTWHKGRGRGRGSLSQPRGYLWQSLAGMLGPSWFMVLEAL